MQKIGRFTPTGRQLVGPGSDLWELDSDDALRHTAIVFHPQYRGHRAINEALDVVRGFLEVPLVAGLVELVHHDRPAGAFIYPTGQSWSAAEVIRTLADRGESGGVRAGLELMFTAGSILNEGAEIGAGSGVYSHGGLTPWRIMLKRDGQTLIVGYALPQVEILQFAEDPSSVPREDSFRYCPPERTEFAEEDWSSDLFGLALIAFELMTGKPVYDGLVDDIRQQAARGEGSRRLFKFREQIPDGVRQLLTTMLRPSRGDRHATGDAFLDEVRRLLGSSEARGPTLAELMEKVASQGKRMGAALEGGKTQMLSKDELVKMMQDEDNAGGPSVRGRWTPTPSRAAPTTPAPVAAPVGAPPQVGTTPLASAARRPVRRTMEPGERDPVARDPVDRDAPTMLPDDLLKGPSPTVTTPPPAPVRPTDLLDRLRANVDAPSAEAQAAREEGRRQAANVIQSILSASSAGGSLQDRLREAQRSTRPPEAGEAPAEDGPRFQPGRARRSPRHTAAPEEPSAAEAPTRAPEPSPFRVVELPRPPEPPRTYETPRPPVVSTPAPPPTAPTPPPPPPMVAEEMGDQVVGARFAAPPPGPPPPGPPPPAPPTTPALATTPAPPPTRSVSQPADTTPGVSSDAGLPRVSRPAVPPEAASVPAAGGGFGAAELSRAPDNLLVARRGDAQLYTFLPGPGARPARLRLPVKSTLGEAVSFLVGYVLPVRTDLAGGLAGWYRLDQEGKALAASAPLEQADASKPLQVRFVPNRVVMADIEVVGAAVPLRFVSPVGTAVPVASLTDHLEAWLGLPDARWRLHRDGRALDPHAILADEPLPGLLRLQLRVSDEVEGGSA